MAFFSCAFQRQSWFQTHISSKFVLGPIPPPSLLFAGDPTWVVVSLVLDRYQPNQAPPSFPSLASIAKAGRDLDAAAFTTTIQLNKKIHNAAMTTEKLLEEENTIMLNLTGYVYEVDANHLQSPY